MLLGRGVEGGGGGARAAAAAAAGAAEAMCKKDNDKTEVKVLHIALI